MRQRHRVPYNQRNHRMVHMIERSLRSHVSEMSGQLYQHPGVSGREQDSLCRMSVPVKTLSSAMKEHEEVTCTGRFAVTVEETTSLVGIVQL